MILTTLHLLLWSLAAMGWGGLFFPCKSDENCLEGEATWGLRGWLGLAFLAMAGMILHCWMPIGGWPSLIAATSGIVLFFWCQKTLQLRWRLGGWLSISAVILLTALGAARPIIHGDSALYHLQATKWIAEYPLLPGLANVHGRFGFNSAWWIDCAWLELPWMRGHSAYLINGLAVIFTGFYMAGAARRVWQQKADAGDWVCIPGIYLWFRQCLGENNPSPSTDLPVNLLTIVTISLVAKSLAKDRGSNLLILAALLGTFATTIKLSALPLAVGCGMLLIYEWFEHGSNASVQNVIGQRKVITATMAIILLYGTVWIGRGLATSGYPLYPSTVGGPIPVRWAVPLNKVKEESNSVKIWARYNSMTPSQASGRSRIQEWITGQHGTKNFLFAGSLLFGLSCLLGAGLLFGRRNRVSLRDYCVPLILSGGGLIFALSMAPAFRFASGYFFSVCGIFCGFVVAWTGLDQRATFNRFLLLVCMGSGLLLHRNAFAERTVFWKNWPETYQPRLETFITRDGFPVLIPHGDEKSWNSPLPGMPGRNDFLIVETDKKGRISGFHQEKWGIQ